MINADELRRKVDWERGVISPEIFASQEIYELEMERLFGRTWLFLAHDSMIPKPGDFFSTYMGGDPVVVARQRDGSVRAFLNVCRHRGMKVCRAEEGNSHHFMCSYHGWTYDGSGALVSVPNEDDAYHGELDKSQWGLVGIRVESYKGLWFGNFDETADSLVDYLGDMAWYIDGWLDHTEGGIEVLPGVVKWTIRGNWKIAAEQFAGDAYHAQVTHLSSFGQVTYTEEQRRQALEAGAAFGSRLGHGQTIVLGRPARFEWHPKIAEYFEEVRGEADLRLGANRPMGANFNVFPNFSGLGQGQNIRVWHPRGPNELQIWSWTVVDVNAPEELKDLQRKSAIRTEGAAGLVEIDDGENWNLMGETLSQGYQARRHPFNYQMGLGYEQTDHPLFPGTIGTHMFNETPQRAFYRRWLEFMTSPEWPTLDSSPTD